MAGIAPQETQALTEDGTINSVVTVADVSNFRKGSTVFVKANGLDTVELIIDQVDTDNLKLVLKDSTGKRVDLTAFTTADNASVTQPEQTDFYEEDDLEQTVADVLAQEGTDLVLGTLDVQGVATFEDDAVFSANAEVQGDLTVTGVIVGEVTLPPVTTIADDLTITELSVYNTPAISSGYPSWAGTTAVSLADGRVFYTGTDGTPAKSALYDPVTNTWTSITGPTSSGLPVGLMGGCLLSGGNVLLVGGSFFFGGSPFGSLTEPILFNTTTNTFSTRATMPPADLTLPKVVALDDNKALVFGGAGADQSCYVFDNVANSWETVGDLPRAPATVMFTAKLASGKVVLAYRDSPGFDLYDPVAETWSSVSESGSSTDLGWRAATTPIAMGQLPGDKLFFYGWHAGFELAIRNTFTEAGGWDTLNLLGEVPPDQEAGTDDTFFAGPVDAGLAVVVSGEAYVFTTEWSNLGATAGVLSSNGTIANVGPDTACMLFVSGSQPVVIGEATFEPQTRIDLTTRVTKILNRDDKFVEFVDDLDATLASVDADGSWLGPVKFKTVLHGTATLVGGTVTVASALVSDDTVILLQRKSGGTAANWGHLYVSAQTDDTNFTISSSNATDDGVVEWFIFYKE